MKEGGAFVVRATLSVVAFQVGDKVQIRVSPVSVFTVLEVDVDGDPSRVLIQGEGTGPGRYPLTYNAADLTPAQ